MRKTLTLVQVYEERFEKPYGFWRPYLQKVIDRYLDCGDLHHGFARVKCRDCQHEYLLAFVLKRSGNPALAGQAPSFLSFLPSEAGGGIWGMALFPRAQEGSPPTCRLQHPENPAPVLPLCGFDICYRHAILISPRKVMIGKPYSLFNLCTCFHSVIFDCSAVE